MDSRPSLVVGAQPRPLRPLITRTTTLADSGDLPRCFFETPLIIAHHHSIEKNNNLWRNRSGGLNAVHQGLNPALLSAYCFVRVPSRVLHWLCFSSKGRNMRATLVPHVSLL